MTTARDQALMQDVNRLLSADLDSISTVAELRAAIAVVLARLGISSEALQAALDAVAEDTSANRAVAEALTDAEDAVLVELAWLHEELRYRLIGLNPRAWAALSDAEQRQRQARFDALFAHAPSYYRRMRSDVLLANLQQQRARFAKASADIAELADLTQSFNGLVDAYAQAHAAKAAEALDDRPLRDALTAARADAARNLRAARALIDAALTFDDSHLTAQDFLAPKP